MSFQVFGLRARLLNSRTHNSARFSFTGVRFITSIFLGSQPSLENWLVACDKINTIAFKAYIQQYLFRAGVVIIFINKHFCI